MPDPVLSLRKQSTRMSVRWAEVAGFSSGLSYFADMAVYLVFLVYLTAVALDPWNDEHNFAFTESLRTALITEEITSPTLNDGFTFLDVATRDNFQEWLEGPVVTALFPPRKPPMDGTGRRRKQAVIDESTQVVGAIRLRQLRVREGGCSVPKNLEDGIFQECSLPYSAHSRSTHPYGGENNKTFTHTEGDDDVFEGRFTTGRFGPYGTEGFIVDLPGDLTQVEARERIRNISRDDYVDGRTRVVFVETTVYNPNVNNFGAVQILVEFPASGGAVPSYSFRILRMVRDSDFDFFVVLRSGLYAAIALSFVAELVSLWRLRLRYFFGSWNLLDMVGLGLLGCFTGFDILDIVTKRSIKLSGNPAQFVDDVIPAVNGQYFAMYVLSVALFVSWLKLFKYFAWYPPAYQLVLVLQQASKDLALFLAVFVVVMFGFATGFHLAFGPDVGDHRTILWSMESLMRMVTGDFDYFAILNSNRFLAPLFFAIFIGVVLLALVNMFVAIILEGYTNLRTGIYIEIDRQLHDAKQLAKHNMWRFRSWFRDRFKDRLQSLRERRFEKVLYKTGMKEGRLTLDKISEEELDLLEKKQRTHQAVDLVELVRRSKASPAPSPVTTPLQPRAMAPMPRLALGDELDSGAGVAGVGGPSGSGRP